jgi:hypothetical protein
LPLSQINSAFSNRRSWVVNAILDADVAGWRKRCHKNTRSPVCSKLQTAAPPLSVPFDYRPAASNALSYQAPPRCGRGLHRRLEDLSCRRPLTRAGKLFDPGPCTGLSSRRLNRTGHKAIECGRCLHQKHQSCPSPTPPPTHRTPRRDPGAPRPENPAGRETSATTPALDAGFPAK